MQSMDDRQNRLRQKAVALQYNLDEHAPKVVAKGGGVIAEKILEKAEESDVAVYQDAKLVEELTRMDLGQHIPPELYEVVAQVLVFINDLDQNAGRGSERGSGNKLSDKLGSLEQELGLERLKSIEFES